MHFWIHLLEFGNSHIWRLEPRLQPQIPKMWRPDPTSLSFGCAQDRRHGASETALRHIAQVQDLDRMWPNRVL